MEYRRYESVVSSFSGSSSDYDKSEDELSYEGNYYESKFVNQGENGSRLFRRWFFNIIDLPNSLTNRLKEWLRTPPGSRGSTSDKSSGTNSVRPTEIHLTGSAESDYDDHEKYNHLRHGDNARKNYRAPGAHRPPKNHHVYHVYKQNEMGFQRGIGGRCDYSTPWPQRNGRFSSSPVLVLPRIDPDSSQPIFHPRSYHSRTSTERRTLTRRNENWRSDIWELKANRYTRLRGDKEVTEDFSNGQHSSQPKTSAIKNNEFLNHGKFEPQSVELKVTASTAFRETISMSLNVEDSQSYNRTMSVDKNNSDGINTKNSRKQNYTELPPLPRVPSLTQPNVEELLRNLREKINSLNAEKKFNAPLGHVSSLIRPETGSRRREHLFSARWQGKSDLFGKETRTTYGEARASFTERIQDIWIQERTSSQWAVLHRHGTHVSTDANCIDTEDISEEKKINRCVLDKIMRINGNKNCMVEKRNNRNNVEKNMKTDGNKNFTEEKKNNLNIVGKNIEISSNESCRAKEINCDENMKIDWNKNCQEKEADCTGTETTSRGITAFTSSSNNEISKPTVCHVAVQYSEPDANTSEELLRPPALRSENNDDKLEIQIPQLLKPPDIYDDIIGNSTQFPSSREIEVFAQCRSEGSTGFTSPLHFFPLESTTTEATEKKLKHFSESTPDGNSSLSENASRNIRDKISKILFLRSNKKRLRNRLKKFPKINLGTSIRFSRVSFLRVKKSRFPKKFRAWIAQKFISDRRSSPLSRRNLGCMGIIFKCTEKSSQSSVPQERQTRSSNDAPSDALSKTEKNTELVLNPKPTRERADKIGVDSSAIEPGSDSNNKRHGERSITTLSVTTSNSTNIPLQLLGSTSDTTVVPSHDRQDDFKLRVAASPDSVEITTRKREIETCEETDDCRADLSSHGLNRQADGISKIFEFGDVLKMENVLGPRMKNRSSENTSVVSPARKREIESCEEIDDCLTDLSPHTLRTDETSKIFEFGDVLKMADDCGQQMKTGADKTSGRVDPTRKRLRSRENCPVVGGRWREPKREKIIVNKKRSLDIENLPSRKGLANKINKITLSEESADEQRANSMKLNRRESIIDIAVNESLKSESKRHNSKIRDKSDGSANRKTVQNAIQGEPSVDRKESKNLEKSQKNQVRSLHSGGFYPELMPAVPSKKLRQRADSPMIPRKSSDSATRRRAASGSSNLPPVGVVNSKCFMSKSEENKSTREETSSEEKHQRSLKSGAKWQRPLNENSKCFSTMIEFNENKSVQEKSSFEVKDENMNSGAKWRPSLKKSSKFNSCSGRKEPSNHRVRFELEKSSNEVESQTELKQKNAGKFDDFSEKMICEWPLREIENKLLVRRIKSSLKNGMPLKRITIVDPHSVPHPGSKFDRGGRSKVEESVIGRAKKSRTDSRNLTSRVERTRAISREDKESVERTCPRRAPSLSEQIPKLVGSFENRHRKEKKLSYRSRSRREDKSYSTDYPIQHSSKNSRKSIVDLAAIKERVENEILEKTSRTSGTEDSDCAIILIKAINSTMEMSDFP